ncbi:hypothetical protein F8388_022353 [Cannabis sativa]|uniref:DUF4283 domain-containing protein n=1 Tax=Cannabis sativa TaxID=3483 RepID=A0A7J6G6W9_CANSA|nr:hypothetical protein F8388_022353 [Cannabis sativa]
MVTIEVDTRDSMIAKTLERDSEMEIEMMDLFEDLSLEDIVANKACVGKVMGCKNMAASVVKKILMGIWNLEDVWRIKKFEDGVLGFFFESEADCTFVMNKRPWLVNGVLLNLKPWPIEGEVRVSEFELACFWVEFHGLPTRCLSKNNIPLLAKKVGQLVKSGGKRKEETGRREAIFLQQHTGGKSFIAMKEHSSMELGRELEAIGREDHWLFERRMEKGLLKHRSKKRKAHQWYQPIPDKLKESPFEEEVHETGTIDNAAPEDKLTDADGKEITVEKFKHGTTNRIL